MNFDILSIFVQEPLTNCWFVQHFGERGLVGHHFRAIALLCCSRIRLQSDDLIYIVVETFDYNVPGPSEKAAKAIR